MKHNFDTGSTEREYTFTSEQDRMSLLAIGACLNSCQVTPITGSLYHVRSAENGAEVVGTITGYKGWLLALLDDYFLYEPYESSQFSKQEVTRLVETLTEAQVLRLLQAMGKDPAHNDPEKWNRFMSAMVERRFDGCGII